MKQLQKRFVLIFLTVLYILSSIGTLAAFAAETTEDIAPPCVQCQEGDTDLVSYLPTRGNTDDYRAWAQSDLRWGNLPLGSSGCTVSSHGCLVTSVTKLIIQCGLRDKSSFDVSVLTRWLNNNNGFTSDGGLYWGKPSSCVSGFSNYGNLLEWGTYSSSSYNDRLISWIKSGYHLVLNVNNGGHWIAVDEAKSLATGKVYIMDSAPGSADIALISRYSTFNVVHAYKGGTTPTLSSTGDILDLGDDFYAHIILEGPWLHIEASKDGDVRIAKDGNNSKDGKQIWHFVKSSDGSYEIGNEYADLRLDAKNWGTEDGTHIGVGTDNDTTAQRWFILKSGTSCKIAASYKPSMVLCSAGNRSDAGSPIQLYSDNNSTGQQFSIYKIDTDGIKYEKPSRPEASSIVSVVTTGDNTVISWKKSELINRFDCREYDVRIWQGNANNIDWGNPYFIEYGVSGISASVQLPAGIYTCCITAVNSYYESWYTVGSFYEFSIKPTCVDHDYSYTVSKAPTVSTSGTLVGICSRCKATTNVLLPKLNATDYTYAVIQEPSCTAIGLGRYTWKTTTYGIFWFEVTLDKTSHSYQVTMTAPTCTERGYTTHTCTFCGDSYIDSYINALGHKWGSPSYVWADDNESVTAMRECKRDSVHIERETAVAVSTVTKEATYEAEGEITYTVTFQNPAFAAQAKVVKTPKLERPMPTVNPFVDVREGQYYYDAVLWAVGNGITAGTSATTFSPKADCTRAQVVTFLWRAAGSPEPKSSYNPFKDIKANAYYYKAVLWAVENKITAGTSATTFSPNASCTRAQVVTFLWRYEGSPAPSSHSNPFQDVKSGSYYYTAVLWAVERNVTSGTSSNTFSPKAACTRAQVVTFLYRDIAYFGKCGTTDKL